MNLTLINIRKRLEAITAFLFFCLFLSVPSEAKDEKLFLRETDILAIREKIDRYPWAKTAFMQMEADILNPRPASSLSTGIAPEIMRLKDIALHYRISGDDSHLGELTDKLKEHYKLDSPAEPLYDLTKRPPSNIWARFMRFDTRLLAAYDLIKGHHSIVDFKDVMDARIKETTEYLKFAVRCIHGPSNTDFWTVTALAEYGFMTGDKEAQDLAINGKWGFKHVLGAFKENGRFRAEGTMYSFLYVDTCLLIIAELARKCGWSEDLYNWEHPKNGASLHKMCLAMFDIAQPDGNLIGRGDHNVEVDIKGSSYSIEKRALFGHPEYFRKSEKAELWYAVYGDPELAWVLSQGPSRSTRCGQFWGPLSLTHGKAEIGPAKAPAVKSEVLPDMGFAFIKSIQGDGYWKSGALTATLVSGAPQLTHNHKDHFSLTLNAFGQDLLSDWFQNWDYLSPRPGRANTTPLSPKAVNHNTVCVDCSDPNLKTVPKFSDIKTQGVSQSISLEGSVYEGVGEKRTIVLTPEYVIDIFSLESQAEHAYDYVLNSFGQLTTPVKGTAYPGLNEEYGLGPIDGKSKKRPGNEWLLDPIMRKCHEKSLNLTFSGTDGVGLNTTMLDSRESVLISTSTPFYVPVGGWDKVPNVRMPERNPMVIVRRKCKSTVFIALHYPQKGEKKNLTFTRKGKILSIQGPGFFDTYDLETGDFIRER